MDGISFMLNFVKIVQVLVIVRRNVSSIYRGPNQATSGECYGRILVTCVDSTIQVYKMLKF
jgi:hypothetical protein